MAGSPLTVDGVLVPEADLDYIWAHWEPRFAASGVDHNIIVKLKEQIGSWSEWCRNWSEVGDDLYRFGEEAEERGAMLTAGESWFRASLLYHFGGMVFIWDMDEYREAHRKKVEAFVRAAPHLKPAGERFEIDFAGAKIPAVVRNPRSDGQPGPAVMIFQGFEGVKEEAETTVAELHARGLATISFDGPGRGELLDAIPLTGDYGPATTAVLDAISVRKDLDMSRIGALGINRGGFLALKAAAEEPRLKALAVTSPGYDRRTTDWGMPWRIAYDMFEFHVKSVAELKEVINQPHLTLEGDVEKISAAVAIVAGSRDAGPHLAGSKRLFDELSGEKQLVVIPGAERNGSNVPYKARPIMADFLAKHL